MKKVTDNNGQLIESKVISTNDIYVGADNNLSLQDKLQKYDEDIYNLRKYTKWYIKYGGMGSGKGGSGGGSSSSNWSFKAYLTKDTFTTEVSDGTLTLDGYGAYTFRVQISKSQGRTFVLHYKIGNATTYSKKTIPAGEISTEVTLRLTQDLGKTLLDFYVENATDEEEGDPVSVTLIPSVYTVNTSLVYQTNRPVPTNSTITIDVYKTLKCKFDAYVYEPEDVYYEVGYRINNGEFISLMEDGPKKFNKPESSEQEMAETHDVITTENLPIDESNIGNVVTIELRYGRSEESMVCPNPIKTTVIPDGYYVLFTDNNNCLYKDFSEEEPENQINKGSLPFYVQLSYQEEGKVESIDLVINRYVGGSWVKYFPSEGDKASHSVLTNNKYTISQLFNGCAISDEGWYQIKGSYNGTVYRETTRYFYVKSTSSEWSYKSYEEDGRTSDGHVYYGSLDRPFITNSVAFYNNSYVKTFNSLTGYYNLNIALGLQFDSSNDKDSVIFRLYNGENYLTVTQNQVKLGTDPIINSYYFPLTDKADVTDRDKWHLFNLNINYMRSSDDGNVRYYEVTILIDGVVEGVSTGTTTNGTTSALNKGFSFKNIEINPNKNLILKMNLFDISYFTIPYKINEDHSNNNHYNRYSYCYDTDACIYYNNYKASLGFDINDTLDFNGYIKSFKFDTNGMPYTEVDVIDHMISETDDSDNKILNTPIIVLHAQSTDDEFFNKWWLASWPEIVENEATQKPGSMQGYISYVPASSKSSIEKSIIYKTNTSDKETFIFDIQGSSTRAYGTKNLNVTIQQNAQAGYCKIFTPNFDKNDTNTFLPEKTFTLKADMVDSSHCNNNAIGDFVNNNTYPIDKDNCKARKTEGIGNHIKNCLTGFPVLVFIHVDSSKEGTFEGKYYFAGIYNFNMGRDSYFNLGYYDTYPEDIIKLAKSTTQGEFQTLEVLEPEFNPNLTVAEISNNSIFNDFSQYQESVLFGADDSDDYSLFSDCVFANEDNSKTKLSNLVKNTALASGYIFEERLEKTLVPIGTDPKSTDYRYKKEFNGISCNCVPDYRTQYTRDGHSTTYHEIAQQQQKGRIDDVYNCICTSKPKDDGTTEKVTPILNLRALVEYYTTCMIFGMVDSVEKNMQLKSWGTTTMYPAFYDMDTALGVDNVGAAVDYFAFSDYWKKSEELVSTGVYKSNGVIIYPDYYYGTGGYDIPSSYLLGLGKYATLDLVGVSEYLPELSPSTDDVFVNGSVLGETPITPVNFYALFRNAGGPLESADKFIDTYFESRLDGIPSSLKNLNYRSKYLKAAYWNIDDYNNDKVDDHRATTIKQIHLSNLDDVSKFQGTCVNKKRNWLNSRLHLLDAYFNINSSIQYRIGKATIEYNGGTPDKYHTNIKSVTWSEIPKGESDYYVYPSIKNISVSINDATINEQIFNSSKNVMDTEGLQVMAPEYTPLVLSVAGQAPSPYLIGSDGDVKYEITIKIENLAWFLYGSKALTYINNLGLFAISSPVITSDNLTEVNFLAADVLTNNKSTFSHFTLNTPNVETVKINGAQYDNGQNLYGGQLKFAENTPFNRLKEINISNTSLTVPYSNSLMNSPVTTLNLSKMNVNGEISFTMLNNIETVNLDNSTITTLSIPLWEKKVSLTSNSSSRHVSSAATSFDCETLTIMNNNASSNGTSVTLSNIKNLKNVNLSQIETVIIENCNKLETIQLSDHVKSLTIKNCSSEATVLRTNGSADNVIDLSSYTKLESLNMYGTTNVQTVKIGSVVKLPSRAFYNCPNLQYLDHTTSGRYVLNGSYVFADSRLFTMKTAENGGYTDIRIGDGITDLTSTFDANTQHNGQSDKKGVITFGAANNFFTINKNNSTVTNINYIFSQQNIVTNNFSEYFANLGTFTKISSANHAFEYNGVRYWSKDLFNFGKDATSISISGCFYTGSVYAQLDFLKNIGSKIVNYSDTSSQGGSEHYTFYTGSTKVEDVVFKDVMQYFGTNLRSIDGFNGVSCTSLSMKDCFNSCTGITSIGWFMYNVNPIKDVVYEGTDSLTSCFQCLSNLTSLGYIFAGAYINGYLDLYNMFTPNQWKQFTNIFSYSDYLTGNFACTKTITHENYKKLVQLLSENTSSSILNFVFRNCRITDCATSPTLSIPYTASRTNITNMNYLFAGTKAFDGDTEISCKLDNDYFAYLPNVSAMRYLFSGVWFNNSIPFDFFKKRNVKSGTGFAKNITYKEIEKDTSTKMYYYYRSNSASKPTTLPTISSGGTVNPNGWTTSELHTTATNKYVYIAWAPKTKPAYTWEFTILNNEWFEKWEPPFQVNYRTSSYANQKASTIAAMFYNCTFEVPYFVYDSNFISDNESYIRKVNGDDVDEYYTDQTCTNLGSYRKSIEIDDLKNIICHVESSPTVSSTTFKNFTVKQNGGESDSHPFVSPDFFYGVTESCWINSSLSNGYNNSSPSGRGFVLEGYLPKHLYCNPNNALSLKGYSSRSSVMYNVNILPVYDSEFVESEKTIKRYVFVPDGFLPQKYGISSLLNFHIRIPNPTTARYYVMYNTSVSSSEQNFSGGLPANTLYGARGLSVIARGDTSGQYDVTKTSYNFGYYLLYNKGLNTDVGFDKVFADMYYNGLISADMIYVATGNLTSSNKYMDNLQVNTGTTDAAIVYGVNEYTNSWQQGGVNMNFKFPEARNAFTNSKLFSNLNYISENSFTGNVDTQKGYWKATFTNLNIR